MKSGPMKNARGRLLILAATLPLLSWFFAPQQAQAALVSYVRSVEYVPITLTSSTAVSVDLTKDQNILNCVPFVTGQFAGLTDFDTILADVYFTAGSPNKVTAQKTGSGTVNLGVFVVEFDSSMVRVQSGTIASFTGLSGTTNIPTAVNQSRAALVFYYKSADSSSDWGYNMVEGWFLDNDTLSWNRDLNPSASISGHYYVFEALNSEFSVQSGTLTIPSGGTTATPLNISSVAMNKTFLIASHRTNRQKDEPTTCSPQVYLNSSTQISASRYGNDAYTVNIRVFAITFAGDETVQRGSFSYAQTDLLKDFTLATPVSPNEAIAWNIVNRQGSMADDDDQEPYHHAAFQRLQLVAGGTKVQGDRGGTMESGKSGTTGRWEVIAFTQSGPSLTLANHASGQAPDAFAATTPVTDVLFRFQLTRFGTVTVSNLRVNLTASGVADGDITSVELWQDVDNDGVVDDPGDTRIEWGVTPSGGVITFTTDFTPSDTGTNYLVKATVSNLVGGDSVTFSVGTAEIDEAQGGITESGSISNATHTYEGPPNLTQIHYRWRNDNGGESVPVPIAAAQTVTGSTTNGTSFALTSWTPGASELVLVAVAVRDETRTVTVSGNGLTFVEIANLDNVQGATGVHLFRAMGASPSTGQITVSIAGNTLPAVAAATRFSGVDTSGSNGSGAIEATATNAGPGTDNNDMKHDIATVTNGAWAYAAGTHRYSAGNSVFTVPGGETGISINNAVGSGTDQTRVSTWYESVPSAGTVTIGVDNDLSAASDWAVIAVSIKPALAPAATFAAAQDTELTGLAKGTLTRVRFEVSNEGSTASGSVAYRLQVAETATCAAGAYGDVPSDSSGHWRVADSTYITDGAATANVTGGLTDEAATFVAGQLKDTSNTTGGITLAVDQFTELEFAVQATANATDGATYCFRLYDSTNARVLYAYSVYARATLTSGYLTLANHSAGQVSDKFTYVSPVTDTLFRFQLGITGTVTVSAIRVNFTTGTVAFSDVSDGELWRDDGDGVFEPGQDTQLGDNVTPSSPVLNFDSLTETAGATYFVRATVSNLVAGDTTTLSVGTADVDVGAGVAKSGSITNATHTQESAPNLTQGHYRWRYDDGSQTSATWAAPQDTKLVAVPRMVLRRLRFEVSNEGLGPGSAQYQLQAARSDSCASATYSALPVSSGDWEIVASSNVADGEATTDFAGSLTNDGTTFVAGQVKDAGNTTATITLGVNQFTEVEFVVRATASALTQANYCFRLYDALNDRALGTYAAYAQASVASGGQMLVRTGSYVGNGGTRVVTGLGFQPDVVLIASEEMGFAGAERYAVIRTSTMSGNLSKSIIYNDADPLADRIVSLDSNGFTVGHPGTEDAAARITCVNHSSSVTYHWTAFRAASGEMTVGTYTGNGSSPRDITGVGFTPDYVIAMPLGVGWSYQHSSEMPVNDSYYFEGTAPLTVGILDLLTDGFRVGTGANWNNEPFHYIAWKEVAGRMSVGKYSGTGVEPLNITDVGFQPANVFVNSGHLKPDTTGASTDKTLAFRCYDNCASTDHIEALLSNGFRLGGDYDTNPDPVLDPPPDNIRHYAAFAAPRLEQVHYRWRNDDGDEAAASWAAGQDTALAGLAPAVPLRLRFEVANENSQSSGAVTYQLQVAQTAACSTGTYTAVPTDSSGHWQVVPSANLTDGAATTNVSPGLTDEASTFVAGQVKDTGNTTASITLAADRFTEIEFSLQAMANASGAYCFRLYDTTGARALDAYGAYAQASLASLVLSDPPSGQVGDQLGTTTPVTGTFFQLRLTAVGAVTVDTLRVRFTTATGIANGDVTAGELWADTNGNGTWDGAGTDTLVEGGINPSSGVLAFSANFTPDTLGTSYFVRATLANLAAGASTTFSLAGADIDTVQAGVGKAGSTTNATHVQDYTSGGDVYYSVGTSSSTDLKTGGPTISIVNGTATLSAAQTGNVGVGDRIEFTGGPVYIKAVVSPAIFVVTTATGTVPSDVLTPTAVTTIRREFVSIGAAVTGSVDGSHLGNNDLAGNNRKLTWVVYNDGPLNVNAATVIGPFTASSASYLTLTVAGASQVASGLSQRHTGIAGTGAAVEVTAAFVGFVIRVDVPYTRVEWLEIDGNNYIVGAGVRNESTGSNALLRYLLIHDVETTGAQADGHAMSIDGDNTTIRNCIAYEYGEDGINVTATGVLVQNTTLHKSTNTSNVGEGIQVTPSNSVVAENVIATDSEFYKDVGGTLTCYNSISSNDSATSATGCGSGGSGNQTYRTAASLYVSATSGYYDLHLRVGSDARDTGLDLSATRLFSDDIDGEARPYGGAWDVGADEAGAASTARLQVLSGSYDGNGSDNRAITVGFRPDVVIVDSVGTTNGNDAIIRTSTMVGDTSKAMDIYGTAPEANQIQSLTATGFTVGTDPDVNEGPAGTGRTFHWVAMKTGTGVMKVGTYTGNGTTQTITGLGFTPVYVIVIPMDGEVVIQRSAPMQNGWSMGFTSEAWNTAITAFLSDGFTVGSRVNQNGVTYHYAAWAAVPGSVSVGSYVGSGTERNITGTGFMPEWAVVTRAYAPAQTGGQGSAPAHKPASTGTATLWSLICDSNGLTTETTNIKALLPDGFRVGTHVRVNANSSNLPNTYHWAAFGPHASPTYHRSIGNAPNTTGGAVTVAAGSTTVTKTGGPSWVAENRGLGDRFTVDGQHYIVSELVSPDSLTLTSPALEDHTATTSYTIARQFVDLQQWENCVSRSGANACTYDGAAGTEYFPTATASLVADDRVEVGVAYREGSDLGTVADTFRAVVIDGSTTDAAHTITLTVAAGNRHGAVPGTPGASVIVDNASIASPAVRISDDYVTVEGLEVRGGGASGAHGIQVDNVTAGGASSVVIRSNLVHVTSGTNNAIYLVDGNPVVDVYNNIAYSTYAGIRLAANLQATARARFLNNTIYNTSSAGIDSSSTANCSRLTAANNVVAITVGNDYAFASSCFDTVTSGNNLSTGGTPPGPGSLPGQNINSLFVNRAAFDLHLSGTSPGRDAGANLSAIFQSDIDNQSRPTGGGGAGFAAWGAFDAGSSWDIGADEYFGTTVVRLASFTARGFDASVLVEWETASELNNLGFNLYRGLSMDGPWGRLNASLIPGLGSSPEGKRYSFLDSGLRNGATYFYRLEDLDRSGKVTSHGPVSATPLAGAGEPGEGGEEGPGEGEGSPAPGEGWTTHGDPSDVSLRVLSRNRDSVTFELRTGGFYSLAQEDGSHRLFVPGFFDLAEPGFPTLPTRRTWTNAVPGLGARVASVTPEDLLGFDGLLPATAGAPQGLAMRDGTFQKAVRPVAAAALGRGLYPRAQARVLQTAFQGDTKKAYVEFAPLRFDPTRGRLVLARRLLVTVAFDGVVPGETGLGGSSGRSLRLKHRPRPDERLLARFVSRTKGLHAVAWDDLLAATTSGAPDLASSALMLPTSALRLSRLGETVPFHVEPRADRFVPGSTLFFLADNSSAYSQDAAYELAVAQDGLRMAQGSPSRGRSTDPLAPLASLLSTSNVERNLEYLPSLLDAPDPWLWTGFLAGPAGMDYPFSLGTPARGPATLRIRLMGASDTAASVDHRVRISLNGTPLTETEWDGLTSHSLETSVPEGILLQGSNTLHLEGFGEPNSAVYLDRFSLEYPHALSSVAGLLEGVALQDGVVQAAGFDPGSVLLDLSGRLPRWLGRSGSQLVFAAEEGHHYLAVSPQALLRPTIRPVEISSLLDPHNQADWILVAPRELLPAAEPLLLHREAQGLATLAVSIEDVYDSFGFGEASPEALRDFLTFAYHHWTPPAPRYVLLLGDATYDPRGFLSGTLRRDLIPSPFTRSSFLWTPSDPLLASVNGEDALPDLALGRITASSLPEAQAAVQKILDFESAGRTLAGNAVLVADNPDVAGDFEANANDIASLMPSRPVQKIFLTQLGTTAAKAAVRNAFDTGAALISYVGHGSASLWASEGLLRSPDVATLAPQPRQPLVLTMTCSNGYFVSPFGNSLIERLSLAPGKGAIAAFSPAGLSIDTAAHVYHRALVQQLESGAHTRLGDLVLAAQAQYTLSGAFPELLAIYHLFGDPALRLR
jgi:hypothetical protein